MQKAVREAVAESGAAVADYRAGSERALNYIVGKVMKKTWGKADMDRWLREDGSWEKK